MKELFAPKHMKMFLIVVIISVVAELAFTYIYFAKKSKLSQQVVEKKEEVDRMLASKDSPRREDNIALRNMIITVEGKNKEVVSYVEGKKLDVPNLSPLEFKEELEKTEAVIRKNAGFPMPEGIGFKRYRGGVIPEAKEVGMLTTELFYTKEILELLINANIVTVERIEWYDMQEDDLISDNYLLEIDFVGNTDSLVKFMTNLQHSRSFIMLHKLSVKRLENLKLMIKARLKIAHFKFDEEKQGGKKTEEKSKKAK